MGKGKPRKKEPALGRALQKKRFGKLNRTMADNVEIQTATEVDVKADTARRLASVTEQNDLIELMHRAELENTQFTAERNNAQIIHKNAFQPRPLAHLSPERVVELEAKLRLPRRPPWTEETSVAELDANEREAFLEWRRSLAQIEEDDSIVFTPFEKNLEVWRQLWRVVEKSDIVIQIVDARNPLLFYFSDLETYVQEVDEDKISLLLVNKADFLSKRARLRWAEYFKKKGIKYLFWSANEEAAANPDSDKAMEVKPRKKHQADDDGDEEDVDKEADGEAEADAIDDIDTAIARSDLTNDRATHAINGRSEEEEEDEDEDEDEEEEEEEEDDEEEEEEEVLPRKITSFKAVDANATSETDTPLTPEDESAIKVFTRAELLDYVLTLHPARYDDEGNLVRTVVGMTGFPNVGKSSTINVLCGEKRVTVSATPGKTKRFQTIMIGDLIMLVDCPGLVFPNFLASKAEMVVNGLLSIDQMRDHIPPVQLVCDRIPKRILETTYGVILPAPADYEDPNRPPTAHELLSAYGFVRGFMTAHGSPDEARAARLVLKDFVTGKLLYCHPPPGDNADPTNSAVDRNNSTLHEETKQEQEKAILAAKPEKKIRRPTLLPDRPQDQSFFRQDKVVAITTGKRGKKGFVRPERPFSAVPLVGPDAPKRRIPPSSSSSIILPSSAPSSATGRKS